MAKRSIPALRKQKETGSVLEGALLGLAGFTVAAAGSWILYSNLVINHKESLPQAFPAERKKFISPTAGQLSYYQNLGQQGRPLVLIHSINAAASAYEMRPLFLRFQTQRPVYVLELPGFGFSERSKRPYSPEMYQAAILDFLETQVRQPADVVALSLGCEFAAQAAFAQPERFNSLVMISPSGFRERSTQRGSQKASNEGTSDKLYDAFAFPLWARPLYDLIATRRSIRYFLEKSFIGEVPPDLIEYDYATSHQPGSENAPLYFISGKLFTPDICRTIYAKLTVPTLVLYDRDAFTSFEQLPGLLSINPNWQAVRIVPTLGLPQFELPNETVDVLNQFWK